MTGKVGQKRAAIFLFYFVLSLYLSVLWYWEGVETKSLSGRLWCTQFFRYVGDSALLIAPFFLLKYRFRKIVFIPVYISTLWVIGSVWYYRFWGDIPDVSSIFLVQNIGSILLHSTLGLMHATDFLFIVTLVILTVSYRWVSIEKLSIKSKSVILGLAICAFGLSQYLNSHVVKAWRTENVHHMSLWEATIERLGNSIESNVFDLKGNGPLCHVLKTTCEAGRILSIRKNLTETDRRYIESFIGRMPDFQMLPDSLVEANRAKNIILVLVESLNSHAVNDSLAGKPVAPVLRRLIEVEGSISALNVVTQIRQGCSGDGQLLVNTGLHPLSQMSASLLFGSSNELPGLPKLLVNHDSRAVFADDGRVWNQRATFRSFGFRNVITSDSIPEEFWNYNGKDGALFNYASELIGNLVQPFFLELVTISMHVPFNDVSIPDSKLMLLSREELNSADVRTKYLAMVNYFDSELGAFIERLKSSGLYDDTILIIVSDHSHFLSLEGEGDNPQMALIIANCGVSMNVERVIGKVDVYPTILNLLGLSGPEGWKGAGRSILDPQLNSAYTPSGIVGLADSEEEERLRAAVDVSELILRTNYFAK